VTGGARVPARLDPAALLARATADLAKGRLHRAAELVGAALNAGPAPALAAQLRLVRAGAWFQAGQLDKAELECRRALAGPVDGTASAAHAHLMVARCLLQRGAGAEAVTATESAFARGADGASAWQTYARALSLERRHRAAIQAAWTAHGRAPPHEPAVRRTLIDVLVSAGEHGEAIRFIEAELPSQAADAALWTSLGLSHDALGHSEAAVAALRQAISLDPGRADANCGLGMALLRLGDLPQGFRHNEHRQKDAGAGWRFGAPPWRGQPLDRAHLLVLAEQGFGDTIQFSRFVPMVGRRAAQVTFLVPPALVRLLSGAATAGRFALASGHPGFGTADVQTLVMSLPHWLGPASAFGAGALPWLRPEPDRVLRWRAALPAGPTIAISWQGNPQYAGEPWRSIPLSRLEPLFALTRQRVTWLSLQKHFGREQLAASPAAGQLIDLADRIDGAGDAFVDSLAILSLVDLFITTDSALAHLAGSAGIPTWVLLSHPADWRWGTSGETTAWYPALRLFRQARGGDWDGVIAEVGEALGAFLACPRRDQLARHSGSKSAAECATPPQVVGAGA